MSEPDEEMWLEGVFGYGATAEDATNDLAQEIKEAKRMHTEDGYQVTRTEIDDAERNPAGGWRRQADLYGHENVMQLSAFPATKVTEAAKLSPPTVKRYRS